jgi:hypothetical protein
MTILIASLVAGCGGAPSAPRVSLFNSINLGRIETVLHEDGSGYNRFWLVVPAGAECELLDLTSRLESISMPTTPESIEVREYQDENFPFPVKVNGYRVTYDFEKVDDIPVQIHNIKRAVVETMKEVIAARPTPPPDSGEYPLPYPVAIGEYYNPNHLSFAIETYSDPLTGQKWNVNVVINPFLMTGLMTEEGYGGLPESCSLTNFTYRLEVSSTMRIDHHQVDPQPSTLREFSDVNQPTASILEWTIDTKGAFEAWEKIQEIELKDLRAEWEIHAEMTPSPDLPAEGIQATVEADQAKYMEAADITNRQFYKLKVDATTPAPWLHFLTGVLAPLLGLVALILGLFLTIRNLSKK